MNLTVDFNDETGNINEQHVKLMKELIVKAAEMEGLSGEVEVSVTFVDEQTIQEMNSEYRGINEPTDVISFALNEEGADEMTVIGAELPNVLGDVIISVPHIKAQAEEYGHSYERELGFLIVHGILHLLGYDHLTEAEEKEMFSRQEDILTAYGLTR